MFGEIEKRLLNDWQRDFPFVPRPFLEIADTFDVLENDVLSTYESLKQRNAISRIGAIVRPNTIGTSTLAAMAVPVEQLDAVAAHVSSYREVNHNYERDHRFNLWFVVTACSEAGRDRVLVSIEEFCNLPVMSLPLAESYHIDLGFDLENSRDGRNDRKVQVPHPASETEINDIDRELLWKLESGLPILARPYAVLGKRLGIDEADVLLRLQGLLDNGIVRRFGVIVRHHEVGFNANAMVVWDVPDNQISDVVGRVVKNKAVTLCYRRPRCLPDWPYNLFTMIHGTSRDQVNEHIAAMRQADGLSRLPFDVLFSERRFKQKGACYKPTAIDADRQEVA